MRRRRTRPLRSLALVMGLCLLAGVPLPAAQDLTDFGTTRNPLDDIRDELVQMLAEAGVPFSDDQQRSITLVLEESRRASEQLFGDVMDFSGGPPQGEELDRARAGIDWMNEDFSQRVRQYLTPEQLMIWDAHVAAQTQVRLVEGGGSTAGTSQQVQQIRINNNPFTAEDQFGGGGGNFQGGNRGRGRGGSYSFAQGGGVRAEIIQRGGLGAWHGQYQFRFQDEALNARNPFASNRPPYQLRNINLNTSGPLIRDRLTIGFGFNQSEQDNARTVNAITPDGSFELGFTQPQVQRRGSIEGTLQLADDQSLQFDTQVNRFNAQNQNVGGFSLPERAINFTGGNTNVSIRHLWFGSNRLVQDISFSSNSQPQEATPVTDGVTISVLGAFSGGGGSQRRSRTNGREQMSALWIYTSDAWTIRTGGVLFRPRTNERSENNFAGTFIFSDLDSFLTGQPILFTQTRGDPVLRRSQLEWSLFFQHELRITDRFTLFLGARYEQQTNLDDRDNLDPRFSLAYALGNSTVVRGGVGLFHARVQNEVENQLARLDGTRQSQIVISNPSYPDPFQTGDVTVVPPSSRRVRADDLVAPQYVSASFQVERSLPDNLFVTASFDFRRGNFLLRSRNLNAAPPGGTERPDPSQGNIWLLESTGLSTDKVFRTTMRQRFMLFTVNASYTWRSEATDTLGTFDAPSDNFDLRADWATEVGHQLNLGVNSRLPLDIYLSADVSFRSGNPYTITTGLDDNGDGETNDRPAGVPRLSERGPARNNVSFNLSKAFVLKRGQGGAADWNVNAFLNVDNAFNRTNFSTPIGILTSPLFGQFNRAFDPRQIEIGARFQF